MDSTNIVERVQPVFPTSKAIDFNFKVLRRCKKGVGSRGINMNLWPTFISLYRECIGYILYILNFYSFSVQSHKALSCSISIKTNAQLCKSKESTIILLGEHHSSYTNGNTVVVASPHANIHRSNQLTIVSAKGSRTRKGRNSRSYIANDLRKMHCNVRSDWSWLKGQIMNEIQLRPQFVTRRSTKSLFVQNVSIAEYILSVAVKGAWIVGMCHRGGRVDVGCALVTMFTNE